VDDRRGGPGRAERRLSRAAARAKVVQPLRVPQIQRAFVLLDPAGAGAVPFDALARECARAAEDDARPPPAAAAHGAGPRRGDGLEDAVEEAILAEPAGQARRGGRRARGGGWRRGNGMGGGGRVDGGWGLRRSAGEMGRDGTAEVARLLDAWGVDPAELAAHLAPGGDGAGGGGGGGGVVACRAS
jgi:hypothetical protein